MLGCLLGMPGVTVGLTLAGLTVDEGLVNDAGVEKVSPGVCLGE